MPTAASHEGLGNTEDKVAMGDPLLVAGGTEMAAFAGKGQKIFMVAFRTLHAGKAVIHVAAFKVAANHLLKIRSPEAVLPFKAFVVDLRKTLKMVFDAAVIIGILGIPVAINVG